MSQSFRFPPLFRTQVTRRVGIGLDAPKKSVAVGHFEVTSSSACSAAPAAPLNIEVEDPRATQAVPAPREYLRIYYGDYLGLTPAKKPRFADEGESTIDCDDWIDWVRQVNPRTRVDAYPLLLVCRDLLDRFVRRELSLVSRRTEELAAALARAQSTVEAQAGELDALRQRLSSEDGRRQVRRAYRSAALARLSGRAFGRPGPGRGPAQLESAAHHGVPHALYLMYTMYI